MRTVSSTGASESAGGELRMMIVSTFSFGGYVRTKLNAYPPANGKHIHSPATELTQPFANELTNPH